MSNGVKYEFTIGNHTAQAHDYTSDLIDEAYRRKGADNPTTHLERAREADSLCEAHYAIIGDFPAESVLSRLAWYIVFDEMTDKNEHKVAQEEYPILSEWQTEYRHGKESSKPDVYTGKDDITIGRRTDHDGVKRRIYDYMTPERDMALVPTKYLDLYSALDNAGLTERQRQAIDLVYFEGMTQEAAGEVMGVKKNTINEMLARSYVSLAKYYEKTRTFT